MRMFGGLIGLLIACGINWLRIPWLKALLRTSYFLPIVMSAAVISLLWKYLMQTDLGVLNYFLSLLHITRAAAAQDIAAFH